MKSLLGFGREFNRHARVGFPSVAASLSRVQEELDEARLAVSRAELEAELADVVLTIASLADAHGLDLDTALVAKHAINMNRLWQPHATIPGAVQHIKEPSK